MKNRVKAKLGGLRQHFACFALRRIHRLSEAIGEEKETLKRTLSESLKALGPRSISIVGFWLMNIVTQQRWR